MNHTYLYNLLKSINIYNRILIIVKTINTANRKKEEKLAKLMKKSKNEIKEEIKKEENTLLLEEIRDLLKKQSKNK